MNIFELLNEFGKKAKNKLAAASNPSTDAAIYKKRTVGSRYIITAGLMMQMP